MLADMDMRTVDSRFRPDLETAVQYLRSVGCTEIYVFGSVGQARPRGRSDLDIAVRGIRPSEYFAVYGELLSRTRHSVDLIDLDLQSEFGSQLAKSGQLRRVV